MKKLLFGVLTSLFVIMGVGCSDELEPTSGVFTGSVWEGELTTYRNSAPGDILSKRQCVLEFRPEERVNFSILRERNKDEYTDYEKKYELRGRNLDWNSGPYGRGWYIKSFTEKKLRLERVDDDPSCTERLDLRRIR